MTNTIILPTKLHMTKDKDGNNVWDYVPYVFEWKTKDEYLAWRADWKATYKALSIESREAKNARNNAFRNKEYAYLFQNKVLILKCNARRLLKIRKEGKALSYAMKTEALTVNNG